MALNDFIDYSFSDFLVPLKATRFLPKIISIDDPVMRYYEAGLNAFITFFQIKACTSLLSAYFK